MLDFSDLAVDPLTGAVSLRAVLPNPNHALLPGMFVKLHLTTAVLDKAFVLPQAAVSRDVHGAYVLAVDGSGKVVQHRVRIEGMTHSQWIVSGDLKNGDRVIVEGIQRVQPGGSARAVVASAPSGATAVGP
jgi:membrane fusion protein (multidrug efflux system)